LNLIDAMRRAGVYRLVFSSSCATYGLAQSIPIDEHHPQAPINPYGRSKLAAEQIIADEGASHGLRYVILRYFNAAGADCDGEIGERHEPEPHVIPRAIIGALDGRYTFKVHGTDYATRDGTAVRDYIHVDDLGDAHRLALSHLVRGGSSDAYNLGTGNGYTVKEIAEAVEMASGRPLPIEFGPRRAGDPPVLVASADKARRVLGWSPTRSSLANIVQTAWRWHANRSRPLVAGSGKIRPTPAENAEPAAKNPRDDSKKSPAAAE
jgi:UDP-arabinose 4-epimerase